MQSRAETEKDQTMTDTPRQPGWYDIFTTRGGLKRERVPHGSVDAELARLGPTAFAKLGTEPVPNVLAGPMHGFFNRLRSLSCIDGDLLPELTAEQQNQFVRDPVDYFIRTDHQQREAIWREIEYRQRTPTEAYLDASKGR